MRPTSILPAIVLAFGCSLLACSLLGCSIIGCSDATPNPPADLPADQQADADTLDASTEDASPADADAAQDTGSNALSLVDHDLWAPVQPANDPFGDAPDQIDCAPQAWGAEEIAPEWTFYVRTQGCNYLTVSQPTLRAVRAGETVNIRLWHFKLTAPAASEAHLGLRLGDHLVWQVYVPIPSDSGLLMDTWTVPADLAAGEDIYFHVHNHGDNEYNLIEVSVSP